MAEKADYIIPRLLKCEERIERLEKELRKIKQMLRSRA